MEDYDVRKGRTYMYLPNEPAFAFGHGLSYTKFQYENLALSAGKVSASDKLRVEFDVSNSGARAGADVAQVYVRPPRGPKKVLRAFRRVTLDAGKKAHISIELVVADLAHYDAQSKHALVDPGSYELLLGASSADIRQRATFDVASP